MDVEGRDVFHRYLHTSQGGLVFSGPGQAHHVLESPALLRLALERQLRLNPSDVEEFLTGFDAYVNNEYNFSMLLKPTAPHLRSNERSHESVMRVLLGVEPLQAKIITRLLERLPGYIQNDDGARELKTQTKNGVSMPSLILQQLFHLDVVFESQELGIKLLEVVAVCPPNMQRDIIAAMPKIVDDSCHEMIVQALQSMMEEQQALTVPILDALSNLTLEDGVAKNAVERIVDSFNSVSCEDLPVVIKFLLHVASKENINLVVSTIRKNLSFLGNKSGKDEQSSEESVLIIDALRTGIRFSKIVAVSILNLLSTIKTQEEHQVLDIWLLLLIHAEMNHQVRAEKEFKKKLSNEIITVNLLRSAIVGHECIVKPMFRSMMNLAEACVRHSSDLILNNVGGKWYKFMFDAVKDAYNRQEVVFALVTHISSKSVDEVTTCIEVLLDICQNPWELAPFYSSLRGLLDYMDEFQDMHVRKLFKLFSILAETQTSESVGNELMIFIRKQLFSPMIKYQRIGIIGGVALLGQIASESPMHVQPQEMPPPSRGRWLSESKMPMRERRVDTEKACNLIELLSDREGVADMLCLLYDELVDLVETEHVHMSVIEYLHQRVGDEFEAKYLLDMELFAAPTDTFGPYELKCENWYSLDIRPSVSVNILPDCSPERSSNLVAMCPWLGLLQSVENAARNGLKDIDGLLMAPIVLFEPQILDIFASLTKEVQFAVCTALFYGINWYRELINAYATQPEAEFHAKVCLRIEHLVELERYLARCVAHFPDFSPLQRDSNKWLSAEKEHKVDEVALTESQMNGESKEPREGKKGGKKTAKTSKTSEAEARYKSLYRELRVSTFCVLNYPLNFDKDKKNESEDEEKVTGVEAKNQLSLSPLALCYLLEDLLCKMQLVLVQKKGFAGQGRKMIPRYLNRYNSHTLITTIAPYFFLLKTDLEMIVDKISAGDYTDQRELVRSLTLILSILKLVFTSCTPTVVSMLLCKFLGLPQGQDVCAAFFALLQNVIPHASCDVRAAVLVLQLMEQTVQLGVSSPASLRSPLSEIAGSLLVRQWGAGAFRTDAVGEMVRMYVHYASQPLETICKLLTVMRSVAEDESVATIFSPTLNTKTFVLYFTPMLQQVVKDHSLLLTSTPDFLETMTKIAESWQTLTRLIRFFPTNQAIMRVALKYDCTFIEKTLKDMRFFNQSFKEFPREILYIIKQVQAGTRMLQAICGDSKRMGRSNITSRVPRIKKLMEQFVYQVAKLFDAYKLTPFIKTSTLRNKTVQGAEIVKPGTDEDTEEEKEEESKTKKRRKRSEPTEKKPKEPKKPKGPKKAKQPKKTKDKLEGEEPKKRRNKRKKKAEDDEETEEEPDKQSHQPEEGQADAEDGQEPEEEAEEQGAETEEGGEDQPEEEAGE